MRVLITGGTGSLGRALTAHFLQNKDITRIVVFSRDEVKQAQMAADYPMDPAPLRFFLGDVRDERRLRHAMQGIDVVIHAAALKRVDAVAYHPFEVLRTNIYGTENVLNIALECGVTKVLFISTDKACQPENIYGSTKMMAEHLTVGFNAIGYPSGMRSSVVRYGNVFGSRGSVRDLWIAAARNDKPLLLTDRRMTRFMITLPQAALLVERVLSEMEGGEVFVPILPAMRMVDLAEAVIQTYGNELTHWEEKGLRPGGEKIHERLLSDDEPKRTIVRDGIFVVKPSHRAWTNEVYAPGNQVLDDFRYSSDAVGMLTVNKLKEMLTENL